MILLRAASRSSLVQFSALMHNTIRNVTNSNYRFFFTKIKFILIFRVFSFFFFFSYEYVGVEK